MNRRFLLDGGEAGWFVYIDSSQRFTPVKVEFSASGEADDWTDAEPCARRGWWNAPSRPVRVRLRGKPGQRIDHYKLMDGIEPSERYPAVLTEGNYCKRVFDDEYPAIDERTQALYEAVRVDTPTPEEVLPVGDLLTLEGRVEPLDGLTWRARLPFELQHRHEYLHLFPGEFADDFQQVVHDEIERLTDVDVAHCFLPRIHQRGSFIEVLIRVPFDPPLTTTRAPTGRRRKSRTVERKVDVRLQIAVPRHVGGLNRVAAKESWDRLLADALAQVRSASVKACGCCDGRGFLEVQA